MENYLAIFALNEKGQIKTAVETPLVQTTLGNFSSNINQLIIEKIKESDSNEIVIRSFNKDE